MRMNGLHRTSFHCSNEWRNERDLENNVWSRWRDCVAAVFGICYVELAFGEQDFNEEIKLGETEERSERE